MKFVLLYKGKETKTTLQKFVHPSSLNYLILYLLISKAERQKGQQMIPILTICTKFCWTLIPNLNLRPYMGEYISYNLNKVTKCEDDNF